MRSKRFAQVRIGDGSQIIQSVRRMTIAFLANRHLTQPRRGLLPDEIFCPRTLQFKLSGVSRVSQAAPRRF